MPMQTSNQTRIIGRIIAPIVSLAAVVMTGGMAAAQTADGPMAECRRIADDASRLACYDGVVDRGAVSAFGLRTPNVAMTVEEFGAEELTPAKPKKVKTKKIRAAQTGEAGSAIDEPLQGPIDTIRERVADLSVDSYGKTTVTLQNGQVWRQLSADGTRFFIPRQSAGVVKIRKTNFGGYMLSDESTNRSMRVVRIK